MGKYTFPPIIVFSISLLLLYIYLVSYVLYCFYSLFLFCVYNVIRSINRVQRWLKSVYTNRLEWK
jgi:cell division protein FtsW (lipid II flippase)